MSQCLVKTCERKPTAKDLCNKHYARLEKNGFLIKKINKSNWSKENIAWVAGLFEGEGCFSLRFYKNKTYISTRIIMTDFDVLSKLKFIVKEGVLSGPYNNVRKDGKARKQWMSWTLNEATPQIALIRSILPWLGKRRKQKALECLKILHKIEFTTRNLYI